MNPARRALLALSLCVATAFAIVALAARAQMPSRVAPAGVAADAFSATRAMSTLARVIGDAPHPTGTAALDDVRNRALDSLRAAGLFPVIAESFVCGAHGSCARVRNVLARLDGPSTEVVLVAAHLDAVPASPGAGDDGQGVAIVIELARALRLRPREGRSFVFLLDEGEEQGLLGMQAFMQQHPWARDVRAVVNLEARGDTGIPVLFEVGGDGSAMSAMASSLRGVFTSSLAAAIYARMPNDTDFSVARDRGLVGANFALIDGVTRYHTARDDRAHLSIASVQAQGDAALSAARALSTADLVPRGKTAWMDVFGFGVIAWRASTAVVLAAIAAALAACAMVIALRRGEVRGGELAIGAGALLATPVAAGLLGEGLRRALVASGALPAVFVANTAPLWIACAAIACVVLAACAVLLRRRVSVLAALVVIAVAEALVALAGAIMLPEATPLALPAACICAASALAFTWSTRARTAVGTTLAVALVAAGPLLSLASMLVLSPTVFGSIGAGPFAAIASLALVGLLPALLDVALAHSARWLVGPPLALALVFALVTARLAPFDEANPQRVNVQVIAMPGQAPRAYVAASWGAMPWGQPPPSMVSALGAAAHRGELAAPWRFQPEPFVELAAVTLPPPTVGVVAREGGMLRLHVASQREARSFALLRRGTPGASVIVNGVSASARQLGNGWYVTLLYGIPKEGFDASVPEGSELLVADVDWKMPDAARAIVAARPLNASPTQEGDAVMSVARVEEVVR